MDTEIAYIGHDNTIDLQLLEDNVAVDLSGVTRMTLQFGDTLMDSDVHAGVFDWSAGNGVLEIALQGQSITANEYYDTQLIVYDAINTNGIVWGKISIVVNE